jgi:endonuclease III
VNPRKQRAGDILDRLAARHPDARIALDYQTPLDLLVATILSAQCTDERVNQVTRTLFPRLPTPESYLALGEAELERLVKPTGFFRQKSAAILGCCMAIVERFDGRVPESMADLVTLPGVGRKTAAVVSSNAFGRREGIAVDTHVGRVSRRLRLTRQRDPVKVERVLMQLYPRERWLEVSDVLIFHGRRICHARRPRCEDCPVADVCPSSTLPRGTKGPGPLVPSS